MKYFISSNEWLLTPNNNWKEIEADLFVTTHSLPQPYVYHPQDKNFSVGNFVINGKKILTPIFYYRHNESPLFLFYSNGINIRGIIIIKFPRGSYYYIYSSEGDTIESIYLPMDNKYNDTYQIDMNDSVIQVHKNEGIYDIIFLFDDNSNFSYDMEDDITRRSYIVYPV